MSRAPSMDFSPARMRRPRQIVSGPMVGKSRTYFYHADWASLAQGGSAGAQIRIDAGYRFFAQGLLFGAYFSSTVNLTTAAGLSGLANLNGMKAKLYRTAWPLAATESNGHLGHLTLQITQSDTPWFDGALRTDLITGEPGSLFLLPQEIPIEGNETLQCILTNNLPTSVGGAGSPPVDAQLVLVGRKIAI
jgi:hypothetical protein